MLNFRVRDLDAMLAQLKAAGVVVDEKIECLEFDASGGLEGNRVEFLGPPFAETDHRRSVPMKLARVFLGGRRRARRPHPRLGRVVG